MSDTIAVLLCSSAHGDRRLMVRGPGRALRARQRLPGHNQGCLCCAPPQSRSAWRFDPDALKKGDDDDDDDGT